MPEFSKSLGNAVRRNRKRMGLSQEKVAESIGCSKRTILMIENHRKYAVNPKMETVYSLVRLLNIDAREIFNPETNRESTAGAQLRLLIGQCNEAEAESLLEIVRATLKVFRKGTESQI